MQSWRIYKHKHRATAFSGYGASIDGGRWNSVGVPVVYTAGSVSLAMLEVLAHGVAESEIHAYEVVPVDFEAALVSTPTMDKLPADWAAPAPSRATQQFGDARVSAGLTPVLRIPSAVNPLEFNYLLNPNHPKWRELQIGNPMRWPFDRRLVK